MDALANGSAPIWEVQQRRRDRRRRRDESLVEKLRLRRLTTAIDALEEQERSPRRHEGRTSLSWKALRLIMTFLSLGVGV